MNLTQRASELQSWINQGRIIEAMNEFYAPDVSMQENANPPTVGREANIERERQFLAQVGQWKGSTVKALGVGDGVTFAEVILEFVSTQGQDVRLEQVSVQRWRDGRIVHERFYYDSGQ